MITVPDTDHRYRTKKAAGCAMKGGTETYAKSKQPSGRGGTMRMSSRLFSAVSSRSVSKHVARFILKLPA